MFEDWTRNLCKQGFWFYDPCGVVVGRDCNIEAPVRISSIWNILSVDQTKIFIYMITEVKNPSVYEPMFYSMYSILNYLRANLIINQCNTRCTWHMFFQWSWRYVKYIHISPFRGIGEPPQLSSTVVDTFRNNRSKASYFFAMLNFCHLWCCCITEFHHHVPCYAVRTTLCCVAYPWNRTIS